jgi:short-subunit dehydrogenase
MPAETALITGASSGIGRELAKLFAADGADLVLVARREDMLRALAQELHRAHGVKAHVVPRTWWSRAPLGDPRLDEREGHRH